MSTLLSSDAKVVGAFIENTIRPLLEEFRWFFSELEKTGIKVTESNVKTVISQIAGYHIRVLLINSATSITTVSVIGYLLWMTLQ